MAASSNVLIIASATAKPGKEAQLVSALREVATYTSAARLHLVRSLPAAGRQRDHRMYRAMGLCRRS
jgi:hypothetical protein